MNLALFLKTNSTFFMKSTILLRILSLLGFLLLMAPFYDQCNGRKQPHEAIISEVDAKDSIPSHKTQDREEINLNPHKDSFLTRAHEFVCDEETQNAYELAEFLGVYYDMTFADFKSEVKDDFKNDNYETISCLIRSLAFLFIIVFSVLQLISSFFKRYKAMYKLSILNLISLLIGIICIVFFDSLFETFRQIKWGFYAFFAVQIALFFLSKRQLKSIPN